MNRFDLLSDPLAPGVAVVEASAGTGKTFTLAGLVLRMLVEPADATPPPTIDQILVVTYTNAATDELRERIRGRLRSALDAFEVGESADPLEQALLSRFSSPENQTRTMQRLEDALTLFDQAAIFTIHGFCQRVLKDRAFETDGLFDAELSADVSELVRQAALDFARHEIAAAEPELVACGVAELLAPDQLLKVARAVQSHADFDVEPSPDLGLADRLIEARRLLLAFWAAHRGEVLGLFGGGRKNAWFNTPYNKDEFAGQVTSTMDRLGSGEAYTPDLAASLKELAWSEVKEAIGKGKAAPDARFFQLVEEFTEARLALGRSWHAQFITSLRGELESRQLLAKTLSFDDLLRRTDAALSAESGSELIATLRRAYRAALIDEFQDTDLLQWRIFRSLFAGSPDGHRLRLIGDPKQAIYGFRGADVATYLAARESVPEDARKTLGTNWRSESGLVSAVNHLFGSHPNPFANPEIAFDRVAASGRTDERPLHGPAGRAPFELWLLGEKDDDTALSQEKAARQTQDVILAEIERLLGDPQATIEGRRVLPRDIAILVPQNHQAIELQGELRRRGIPSVLQAAESVFASEEVATLERFIAALDSPHSEGRLRLLLACPAMGFSLAEFNRMDADASFAADVTGRFSRHVARWTVGGFAAAFRSWLDGEDVRARLMAWPDGERRLTNLLHLGELLQKAEQEGRSGIGLLRWLEEQKADAARAAEESEMRLESDESAVKLVTVHKSKGLEYPIVFCAFLWRSIEPSGRRRGDPLVVRRQGQKPLIDLSGYEASSHRSAVDSEMLQEHLRLLYVALTRAKNRCYLLTGPIGSMESSALAWLLHGRTGNGDAVEWEALTAKVSGMTRAAMAAGLAALATDSRGTIRVVDRLPVVDGQSGKWSQATRSVGAAREYVRSGFDAWRIQSYSGLIAGAAEEAPDHDATELAMPAADEMAEDEFARLPRGTSLGTCVHEILEKIDFAAEPETWASVVELKLNEHRLDVATWAGTVHRMLRRTLRSTPNLTGPPFSLSEVSLSQRITELEFFIPTKRFSVDGLRKAFSRHASAVPVPEWPSRIADLGFQQTDGFLHGYIDAVIEHGGRYYVVDWKTNWLGSTASAYDPATIGKAMRAGFYVLQYHLYAVAVRRFLQLRLGAKPFNDVWGGVLYGFLRGIDPEVRGQGWFFHRLDEALLDDLEFALEQGGDA